jgi:hypothetical protein
VAFLPKELTTSKERSCLLLPTNYAAPLVENLWKILVGVNLSLIVIAEKSL